MNSVVLSEEAVPHLGAILLWFNRAAPDSLLDQAHELAKAGQTAAAVLIAGTVLGDLDGSLADVVAPEQRTQFNVWRQLRNQVAHDSVRVVTMEQALRMIDGVRELISVGQMPAQPAQQGRTHTGGGATSVRGKYAYVRTSSEDFMRRKREEVEREER